MLKNVRITTNEDFIFCFDNVYSIVRIADDYISVKINSIDGPFKRIHLDPYFEGRIVSVEINYQEV